MELSSSDGILLFPPDLFLWAKLLFELRHPTSHFLEPRRLRDDAPRFPTSTDLDNLIKLVLNACQGIIFANDQCIIALSSMKRFLAMGRMHMTFSTI